jgi:DNA-binding NarL/FixJ family response regulator
VLGGEALRIFIADADRELRLALQILIHQESGMYVTGMAVRTEGLAAQVAASQPDVLLLDWHLPGGSIADVLAELGQSGSRPKVVAMSVNPDTEQDAMASGADSFVAKNVPPGELLGSLRSIEARS